jgi:hypothetical protein
MKRLIITLAAMAALAVAMPAGVLAKHHGHHGKRHGHHSRLLRFGSLSTSNNTGTTGPTGPTGPSGPEAGDTAGTVDSFDGTKLVIKLNDGSTVSGNVTSATEIECEAPHQAGATGDDDSTEGVDNDDAQGDNENGQQPSGTQTTTTPQAHESDSGERGDDNGDSGDQGSSQTACGPSALTPGTVVKEAELLVGPGGSVFHSVHLIK